MAHSPAGREADQQGSGDDEQETADPENDHLTVSSSEQPVSSGV